MRTSLHIKLHKANWNKQNGKFFPFYSSAISPSQLLFLVTYFPKHYFSRKMYVQCYELEYTINLTTGSNFMRKQKNRRLVHQTHSSFYNYNFIRIQHTNSTQSTHIYSLPTYKFQYTYYYRINFSIRGNDVIQSVHLSDYEMHFAEDCEFCFMVLTVHSLLNPEGI